jgi:hypothetical protein
MKTECLAAWSLLCSTLVSRPKKKYRIEHLRYDFGKSDLTAALLPKYLPVLLL